MREYEPEHREELFRDWNYNSDLMIVGVGGIEHVVRRVGTLLCRGFVLAALEVRSVHSGILLLQGPVHLHCTGGCVIFAQNPDWSALILLFALCRSPASSFNAVSCEAELSRQAEVVAAQRHGSIITTHVLGGGWLLSALSLQ